MPTAGRSIARSSGDPSTPWPLVCIIWYSEITTFYPRHLVDLHCRLIIREPFVVVIDELDNSQEIGLPDVVLVLQWDLTAFEIL